MRSVGTFVICAAILGALGTRAAVTELPPPSGELQANSVRSRRGTPLASLIKPGQATVVVEKDQSPPLAVGPPRGTGQLEWLTQLAEAVMIVRVARIVPELTPEGDWIKSTVHASVEDVLKSPPIYPFEEIRFGQDAGEMRIAGTAVRAVLPWADPFEIGSRYLVFAATTSEPDEYLVGPNDAYLVSSFDQKLVPLAKRGTVTSERGVPITTAEGRVRAAAQKKDRNR